MQFPQLLKQYTVALIHHWSMKNKYNFQGQRRCTDLIKDLSDSIKPEQEISDNRNKLARVLAKFWVQGETLNAGSHYCLFPYRISGLKDSSLRGTLIPLITPGVNVAQLNQLTPVTIAADFIKPQLNALEEKPGFAEFLRRKSSLLCFLNQYIATHAQSWNKWHGVNRAFELADILTKCKSEAELNVALANFIHTGKVGSDFNTLNIHAASSLDDFALRGGLIKFLFEPEAEHNKLILTDTPKLIPMKPKTMKVAKVKPLEPYQEVLEDIEQTEEQEMQLEENAHTKFLKSLPTLTPAMIANQLFKFPVEDFDQPLAAQAAVAEENSSSWWCLPSLSRILGYR
jgi:hypothetical protein